MKDVLGYYYNLIMICLKVFGFLSFLGLFPIMLAFIIEDTKPFTKEEKAAQKRYGI